MNKETFQWLTDDGTQRFARLWEPNETQAIVCLVHGLGEHSGRYEHVAAAFNKAGYALLAIDLLGHGRSEGQRGHAASYETLLADVTYLLEKGRERYRGKPVILYGHSMGGNLVLNYALRHNNQNLAGVIATSPWLRLAFAPPSAQLMLAKAMSRIWPSLSQPNGLDTTHLSHDENVARAYEADPLVHGKISVGLFMAMYAAGEWAIENARKFPLPLLLMHGEEDQITSATASQEFGGKVNTNTTKIWPSLYHETHNEVEKDNVIRFMLDWLSSIVPST